MDKGGIFAKQYAYNTRFFKVVQVSSGGLGSKFVWWAGYSAARKIPLRVEVIQKRLKNRGKSLPGSDFGFEGGDAFFED